MYFKYCWGFNGNEDQIKWEKEQLVDMLEKLGCKVKLETQPDCTEDTFVITVEKEE